MSKTEFELNVELWWDSLTDNQQNWLNDRFFKDENLDTLKKVIHCYKSLSREELLELSSKNNE